jgi:hypothetical protein
MDKSEVKTCPEMVSRGSWSPRERCGRPVKQDGLCGIHATAKRKADEKDQAYRAKVNESAEAKARANRYAERLGAGKPNRHDPINGIGHYTGGLVLTQEEVQALLSELGR